MRLYYLFLILVVFFFVLQMNPGLASDTRIVSMGNANALIKDYYNIDIFPSTIVNYPNHLIIGFGGQPFYYEGYQPETDDRPFVGATIGIRKGHVFGVIVNGQREQLEYTPLTTNYQYDLFYGMEMSALNLGLRLHRASGIDKVSGYSEVDNANNYEQSVGIWGVTGSISMNVQDTGTLEAAITYKNIGFTNERGNEKITEPEGCNALTVESRLFYPFNLKTDFIPYFRFQTMGLGRKVYQNNERAYTETESDNEIMLGLGLNHRPKENMLFIGGLAFVRFDATYKLEPREADKTEEKSGATFFPMAHFGFETQLKSWLSFRGGFQKLVGSEYEESKDDQDTIKKKLSSSPFGFSVGLGFKIQDLILDVTLDRDYLKRGPYILGGSSGRMFPRASATYVF